MTERIQRIRDAVKEQLRSASPEYASISITLGLFESLHTAKQSAEPLPSYEVTSSTSPNATQNGNLLEVWLLFYPGIMCCHVQDDQQACLETFGHFVEQLRGDLSTKGVTNRRVGLHWLCGASVTERACAAHMLPLTPQIIIPLHT